MELRGSGAEPLEEEDPPRIGPIPLAGRLGSGGMGRVYLGFHEGRYVAVKQLLASVVGEDEDFLRRFGHELDNLSRLPATATAPLLASDRTARPPWFATGYVPGLTLRQALDLHGRPLPSRALWLLLKEAAQGLTAVHALGMVHRDVKPSNVMLTLDGLTLIDFGVARAAEQSRLTRTGMVVGTPAYMAPEQAVATGGSPGAADVFALGSVLVYAACRRPPFGDDAGHGVLYRIVHQEPDLEPLRGLDPELAEVVEACLAKDPEARPTAAALLERAVAHGPFVAPLWPDSVTALLDERAAFAAEVRRADVPTVPLGGGKPEREKQSGTGPEPGRGTGPDAGPALPRSERPGRRRNRLLLAVVPVVAGGVTLAVQYLPYVTSPPPGAQATPSASAPVSAGAGPSAAGADPSEAVTPDESPAGDKDGKKGGEHGKDKNEDREEKEKGGGTGASAGGSGGASAGAREGGGANGGSSTPGGGSGTPGGGGGAGDAGGSGVSAGSGGSSGSGGGSPAPPAPATPRYGNGSTGDCLIVVYGAADHGSCSDPTARWTVRGRSDGSFTLVSAKTGQCLYANFIGQAVFAGDCSAFGTSRLWRTGSGGSLHSEFSDGCLDLNMAGGLVTKPCSGAASQRWTKR
ncbi:serine/threonine-protein kinase [Streptomyces sp. NBC_01754]|uniref:serine/threonine-protein kinase n=1 Tax=Streptomyces sp. NBC_01754 TaxID=2975930 RepID=UPI003FA349DA